MTIPQEIIELALKGGWLETPYTRQIERSGRDRGWTFRYFIPNKKGDTFPSDSYKFDEEIALDPLFWQSLGKELGWQYSSNAGIVITWGWEHYANKFIDLILTGKDTTPFWEELTK